MDRAPYGWRCVKPSRAQSTVTEGQLIMLQCYNSLLLIAGLMFN